MQERPRGNTLFLLGHGPGAGEIRRERTVLRFLGQRERHLGLRGPAHLTDNDRQEVGEVSGLGQFARKKVEGSSAQFTSALGGLLSAEARGQVAHGQGHHEVSAEQHHVGGARDAKREDRRHETEIPEQRGERRRNQRRATSHKHRQHDDAEEVDHGQ